MEKRRWAINIVSFESEPSLYQQRKGVVPMSEQSTVYVKPQASDALAEIALLLCLIVGSTGPRLREVSISTRSELRLVERGKIRYPFRGGVW